MFLNMKPAERRLLEACQKGKVLDLGNEQRPKERTDDNEIRGEFLRHLILCNNQEIIDEKWEKYVLKIDPSGIIFSGVYISGKFDFSFCNTDLPFLFTNSVFENKINFYYSKVKLLNLRDSKITSFIGQGLICQSDIFLDNTFQADGEVDFNSSQIENNFYCTNGKFNNENGCALNCENISINGNLLLNNFKSIGSVNFTNAKVEGNVACLNANIKSSNNENYSLSFNSANINGNVFLRNTHSIGEVNLGSAKIGLSLECTNAKFINESNNGKSLNCFRIEVGGKVFLKNNFKSIGIVNFNSSQIGDNFDCCGGNFFNDFTCNGAKIIGTVFLKNGFESNGEVDFTSSEVGSLECTGGKFLNEKKALSFNSSKINGMVFLNDGFESNGEIDFISAEISGSLDCGNGKFNANLSDKALNFEGAKINKNVFLNNNFESNGIIDFGYSQIGNTLELSNLNVKGNFILTSTKINIIWIDDNFWEKKDFRNLQLDGLEYNHLSGKSVDSKTLSSWFEKMPKNETFKPQPYKQLAKVLRNMGHSEDADNIMIKYSEELRKKDFVTCNRLFISILKWIYGVTAGYGYKPMRVFVTIFIIWFSCGLFYQQTANVAVFAPSNPLVFQYEKYNVKILDEATSIGDFFNNAEYECNNDVNIICNNWTKSKKLQGEYTTFSPFWYSLDILLPIVDLQMDKDWGVFISPINSDITLNHVTRWIVWIEILLGWIYSLILVAILSGLAKNEKD